MEVALTVIAGLVACGVVYLAVTTKKRREESRRKQAARTDGTPYDPNIPPTADEVQNRAMGPK